MSALEALNRLIKPDLILLARGGGSLEDLMAFNDEQVARAIVSSPAPIISGIGHETDFTIADFAADLRAPTPTAAAELATPNQADLRVSLSQLRKNIHQSTINFLFDQRRWLEGQQNRLLLRTPLARVHRDQQRLDELNYRAGRSLYHAIEINRTRLAGMELRLNALNPDAILARGYSLVTQPDGSLVRSTKQVQPDDALSVRVSDGEFEVRVQEPGSVE
jgi:exodeoxyribonuclease VII large subunit